MTDKELAEEYRKKLKQRLIDEDDFEIDVNNILVESY